jgi:hypothetical protein
VDGGQNLNFFAIFQIFVAQAVKKWLVFNLKDQIRRPEEGVNEVN